MSVNTGSSYHTEQHQRNIKIVNIVIQHVMNINTAVYVIFKKVIIKYL